MSNADCIFCKIVNGAIASTKLYEDDEILVFEDVSPVAACHFLVIPKEHLPTLDDASEAHRELLGKIVLTGARIAREKGVAMSGYRQLINCRADSGQVVFHLHAHFIGGRKLGPMA
jgi:histidine triad (HIT) family protein